MRAVSVRIVGAILTREVHALYNARSIIGVLERNMRWVNSRIEHGDTDAAAVERGTSPAGCLAARGINAGVEDADDGDAGISEALIRVAVGLESVSDLKRDLAHALASR